MTDHLPEPGRRIQLLHTNDRFTRLQPGACGTVTGVRTEPEPTIEVEWDFGSTLSLLPEAGDRWRYLTALSDPANVQFEVVTDEE